MKRARLAALFALLLLVVCMVPLAKGQFAIAAQSPLLSAAPLDDQGQALVESVLKTGRYRYVKLQGSPPGTWHVMLGEAPVPGALVSYKGYAGLKNFHSRTLDRTFDHVIFSSLTPLTQGVTP